MQNESRIEMEVPKCFHSTIFYNYKGENPLRAQIGPLKPQNMKNILERVITPQYNVEVL